MKIRCFTARSSIVAKSTVVEETSGVPRGQAAHTWSVLVLRNQPSGQATQLMLRASSSYPRGHAGVGNMVGKSDGCGEGSDVGDGEGFCEGRRSGCSKFSSLLRFR